MKSTKEASTIEIQGISKQFMPGTEVSVLGGTGKFRSARDYATFKEEHLEIPNRSLLSGVTLLCNISSRKYLRSHRNNIWTSHQLMLAIKQFLRNKHCHNNTWEQRGDAKVLFLGY